MLVIFNNMINKKKVNKVICFDIDGVICQTSSNNYKNSTPIKKNIKIINELYEKGFYIKIFTARFMGRTNDNRKLAEIKAKKLTIKQLNSWGVKYHKIFFGKISYDILIDDKCFFFRKDWNKKIFKNF